MNDSVVGMRRREFLQLAGAASIKVLASSQAHALSVGPLAHDTRLIWGIAQDPNDISNNPNTGVNTISDVEKDLQQHGAGKDFHFGGIRIYLRSDDADIYYGDPAGLSHVDNRPYTPLHQGPRGNLYVPVISLRAKARAGKTITKYPQVWAGKLDENWKKLL
ncbi:MAG: hypothetical protein ABI142_02175, partial [Bryocella sp.]